MLLVVLPFRYIASDVGVDVVPSALWARLQEALAGEVVTARKLMVLGVLVLLALVALLPRRLWWVLPAVLLATFAATGALAWERIANATENSVFEGAPERGWVDGLLPDDASVTKVYLVTTDCPASALTWHALYLTEFFNRSLERAAYIGDSIPDGLPIRRVDVARTERSRTPPTNRCWPTTWSRSPESSSPARSSAAARLRTSCSGGRTDPCASSARARTPTCARTTAARTTAVETTCGGICRGSPLISALPPSPAAGSRSG